MRLTPFYTNLESENLKRQLTIFDPPTIGCNTYHQRPAQMIKHFAQHGYNAIYCNRTQLDKPQEILEPNLTICHNINKDIVSFSDIGIYYSTHPCHLNILDKAIGLRFIKQPKLIWYDLLDYFR